MSWFIVKNMKLLIVHIFHNILFSDLKTVYQLYTLMCPLLKELNNNEA